MAVTQSEAEHGTGSPFGGQRIHCLSNIELFPSVSDRRRVWDNLVIAQIPTPRLATIVIEKAAIGDPHQPSPDVLNIREAISDPEGFEKRILRQLISKGTIPTEPAQKGTDRALMGADDRVKVADPVQD